MRGHLEARGKNVWRAKVYLGCVDGKNKRYLQRTIHGSKRQAEDVMNELLVEAGQSSNEIVDGTFGDLAREVARALFGDALTDDVARIPAIARPIDPSQIWPNESAHHPCRRPRRLLCLPSPWRRKGRRTARRSERPPCACADPAAPKSGSQMELDHHEPCDRARRGSIRRPSSCRHRKRSCAWSNLLMIATPTWVASFGWRQLPVPEEVNFARCAGRMSTAPRYG